MRQSATHANVSARAPRMARLYFRLQALGFAPTFVRRQVLPEWWQDSTANNPAAYAHGAGIIAKNLGLDVRTLLADGVRLAYQEMVLARLKANKGVAESELLPARSVCIRVAQIACAAARAAPGPIAETARAIRSAIQGAEHRVVDLDALLDYCWSAGIPVVYVSQLPPRQKRLAGLAAEFEGRPAVVVSKNSRFSADLAFVLAHELGHLVLGHVEANGAIGDQEVQAALDIGDAAAAPELRPGSSDEQEDEANAFATELLTGKAGARYTALRSLTAVELADIARQVAALRGVDPGVVALNYAWNKGHWGAGKGALKLIEPDANAPATVCAAMLRGLDFHSMPSDSRGFLLRVTVGGSGSHDLPGGHRPPG